MIVLAYVVSRNLVPTFLKTLLVQRRIAAKASDGYRVIVASDESWSAESVGIKRAQVIKSDLWTGGEFRISKARNVCLKTASDMGAEWVLLFDADGVLVRPVTLWPTTGLGDIKGRVQLKGETPSQSLSFFDRPVTQDTESLAERGLTHGWFVLRRDVFMKNRFDESYVGWGAEDRAFPKSLAEKGIHYSPCNACAIHLWHPTRNHSRADINWQKFQKR